MARKSIDRAHEFTTLEIDLYMRQLAHATQVLTEFRTLAESMENKRICAHNKKTLDRAVSFLMSGCNALQRSISLHRVGFVVEPGATKPRSKVNKPEVVKHGRKSKTNG
jgi:hypothetical protein